ncbi:MAG: PPOX class F420-dependent oxidoreductase [Gaiellaceae bacterium]
MAELDQGIRALFERPNFAHLATTLRDGSPHTVPVWAGVEDGRIVFFTQPASQKAKNLARDPRAAISVVDFEQPYRSAWVRGRVAATRKGEPALEVTDRLSLKYTGASFPLRSGIVYEIEPERQQLVELPFTHSPS